VDEVEFVIRLLSDNWSNASTIAAGKKNVKQSNGNAWTYTPTPLFVDIRPLEPGRGKRLDVDEKAVIIVSEDNASVSHPTIDRAVRNEEYGFTLHLRVLHRRDYTELTYSRRLLQVLYQMARHILEKNGLRPKVYDDSDTLEASAELIEITGRSEANDRGKKLLGYRIPVTMKRFGRTI